jgi:hypothetical protein
MLALVYKRSLRRLGWVAEASEAFRLRLKRKVLR